MTRLFIRHLRITITTAGGKFGCSIPFVDGLNIIRAENSSGKSTCLNTLAYALGLEEILGRSGVQALKPAVKSELEYEGRDYRVHDSFVELEISNQANEIITVKRQIVGRIDTRLVLVNRGALLSNGGRNGNTQDEFYYVRDAGAARRERGFHRFLADFLGLDLPLVDTYEEKEVPLYLECIFPLFFIEQKRGWSNIQATTPTKYRIRNVAKAATEYVLKLDVAANQNKKKEIELEKASVRSEWLSLGSTLSFYAQQVGGLLNNFPNQPVASVDESRQPNIAIFEGEKWLSLDSWIIQEREKLLGMKGELRDTVEDIQETNSNLQQELNELEEALLFQEAAAAKARDDYFNEESNRNLLNERLEALEEDLIKNQDALKLQKYGASLQTSVAFGDCPTCHQPVVDSLLEQPSSHTPMSLEKNIEFIKQQKHAATLLLSQAEQNLVTKKSIYIRRQESTATLRKRIQDLKTNLVQDSRLPNIALLREIIASEERLQRAEAIRDQFEEKLEEVANLTGKWLAVLEAEANLPKDFFSDVDKQKLSKLKDLFRENIVGFGFRSAHPESIEISPDTYRPIIEGFEMAFDASASDNIRIIWAYTLALQGLASYFDTNHPRVSFFDEPGQQQVKRDSRRVFYKQIGAFESPNQFITTTSENPEILNSYLIDVRHKLIEFGTKVLRPIE